MTDGAAPDFKNPNREPVISIMDLARLDDEEMREGYSDGFEGLPCGDNRSRSYWHGWRNGSHDGKHREGDFWDSLLARAVVPLGAVSELTGRVEACRKMLRESGQMA
jgi:hypothetical protein